MPIVFDAFTGQIIDTGAASSSSVSIGGPVTGASANSVLVVDASLTLQDVPLSTGELVTLQGGSLVASSITGDNAQQISVDSTTHANEIRLSLPQDIGTSSTVTFGNVNVTGTLDTTLASGTLNVGTTNASTINIGNVGATVNIQGTTFYQDVTNLNVKDKNITVNSGGSAGSAGSAGLHVEENAVVTGYVEVSTDRLSWLLKSPDTVGIVTLTPGVAGITIDQSSHDPVTIDGVNGNGLNVSGQVLSLDLADATTTGALSSTDWNTFDGKQDALGYTPEDVANKSTDTALGTSDTLYPSQNAVKSYVDGVAGSYLPVSTFDAYNLVQKEPTGFADASTTTISFNDATREFTIAPASGSYDVYVKGAKYTKSTSLTTTISTSTGNHYIYFDASGNLVNTDVFSSNIFLDNAFVSIVYWNNTTGSHVYFANERHGLVMDGMTHTYLHTVFGARFLSGGALQNFSVDGTGNNATDAQFTSDSGSIRDEDLLIQYLAQTQIPILYRINTEWRKKTADAYPVIYSGTAGYTGANGRLPYNLLSGGNWSLSEVPNNQYVLVHIFATNDIDNPVVGVQGINAYNSVSGARTGAISEITALTGLPFAEFVALGTVIFETANTYTNVPKARIRSTDTGADYVDFRGTQTYTPSGAVATSHSLLSNLSNDDHLQYFNEARGDARYYTQTQVDTLLTGKQPVGNYITDLTGDVTASGPGSVGATLAAVGTAGTYVKVTTDSKGRVTSGSTQIDAATEISGILPFANGGLGFNTYPGANYVIGFNNANNAIESKNIAAGTGISISHGVNTITISASGASGGDIPPTTWTGLLNNFTNQYITGLMLSYSVTSFIAYMSIYIDATTDLYTSVEIRGLRKDPSNWSSYELQFNYIGDTISLLDFNMVNNGQMMMTIGNIPGFNNAVVKFRAFSLT